MAVSEDCCTTVSGNCWESCEKHLDVYWIASFDYASSFGSANVYIYVVTIPPCGPVDDALPTIRSC